ncbi:MAG: 4Fe-4S dicluster domain-containing protein [Candidatus Krumholzibacteria bacterium]|jgi:heterodisulfide reductase subunit C|nr:4Fe-4S dicluster domain-containing protein [Candidatus Krumholzibacteria bacterium]
MSTDAHHDKATASLAGAILEQTGVPVDKCYQCGKCSAGCPLAADMDYPPSLILRMLQAGGPELEEKVLRSYTIWVCLTCETCYSRCPMEIDIPVMMDYLRHESLRLGMTSPRAKDIIRFHRSFLDSIKYTGRLYEVGLVVDYKARSMHLLQDVKLAPKMYFKGKLNLIPETIKGLPLIRRIFSRSSKAGGEDAR